jgi:hypothetical protein
MLISGSSPPEFSFFLVLKAKARKMMIPVEKRTWFLHFDSSPEHAHTDTATGHD